MNFAVAVVAGVGPDHERLAKFHFAAAGVASSSLLPDRTAANRRKPGRKKIGRRSSYAR